MERWLDVTDHSNYEVSNLGQVRNKKTGKILVPRGQTSNGSLRVYMDGKKYYIHRLVANAFMDIDETKSIGHIDEDYHNNELSNLKVLGESSVSRYKRKQTRVVTCANCIHYGEFSACEDASDDFYCAHGEC